MLDWKEIRQVLAQANWRLLPLALLFTGLCYTCMSFAYAVANRLFGVTMKLAELAQVGFVSQVLNHLLSSGGAAGLPVRFLTMGRQGVSGQDILAASFVHFYFTSLGMLALLPAGLAYVFFRHPLSGGLTRAVGLGMILLLLIFLLATLTVFVRPVRTAVIGLVARAGRAVTRRDLDATLAEFNDTISRGVSESRRRTATTTGQQRRRAERLWKCGKLSAADGSEFPTFPQPLLRRKGSSAISAIIAPVPPGRPLMSSVTREVASFLIVKWPCF